MQLALVYLGKRFFYRLFEFLRHWYIKSARLYFNYVLNKLENIDRYLAWRITFKNLLQPLYRDYSIVGYVLGFVFRSFRLCLASIIYGFLFVIIVIGYILWISIPPYLVYQIILSIQ